MTSAISILTNTSRLWSLSWSEGKCPTRLPSHLKNPSFLQLLHRSIMASYVPYLWTLPHRRWWLILGFCSKQQEQTTGHINRTRKLDTSWSSANLQIVPLLFSTAGSWSRYDFVRLYTQKWVTYVIYQHRNDRYYVGSLFLSLNDPINISDRPDLW